MPALTLTHWRTADEPEIYHWIIRVRLETAWLHRTQGLKGPKRLKAVGGQASVEGGSLKAICFQDLLMSWGSGAKLFPKKTWRQIPSCTPDELSNQIALQCLSLKYCNMWKLHVYWCFLLNSTLLLVMFFPNVDRWCCFLGGPVPQHGAFNRCSHLWDITFFLHTMAAKQKHNLHQQLTTPPFTNI